MSLRRLPLLILLLVPAGIAAVEPPGNLRIVESGESWARLRWDVSPDPAAVGYRLKYSLEPGSHPGMGDWNGRQAALSFSSDDGRVDNLTWVRVFDRHGAEFTAFIVPSFLGDPGFLTPSEVQMIHAHGHEIGSHSYTHGYLVRDTAIAVSYAGGAETCLLECRNDSLRTWLDGTELDLNFDLNDNSCRILYTLANAIDAEPDYDASLEYYACGADYCCSTGLVDLAPVDIAAEPETMLTRFGTDSLSLVAELVDSRDYLEELLGGESYRCVSFAYPRHLHDQREMNAVMEAGYLIARNGNVSAVYPSGSTATLNYLDRVNTYQVPYAWNFPPDNLPEANYRQRVRNDIGWWKDTGQWVSVHGAHTLADCDSAHVDWAIDEIVADGGIWVASYGEIADYVRQYHVTVENPVEKGSDSRPRPPRSTICPRTRWSTWWPWPTIRWTTKARGRTRWPSLPATPRSCSPPARSATRTRCSSCAAPIR